MGHVIMTHPTCNCNYTHDLHEWVSILDSGVILLKLSVVSPMGPYASIKEMTSFN